MPAPEESAGSAPDGPPPRPGLTLLEGVLILAVVAAVAIVAVAGNARQARLVGNESAAIASLKTLVTAEEQYKSTGVVYVTLSVLSGSRPPYLDAILGTGRKRGYSFFMVVGTPADSNYYVKARPVKPGVTGKRSFFVDSSGVIRVFPQGVEPSSADSTID